MHGSTIRFALAALALAACTLDFDAVGPFGGAGQDGGSATAGASASGGSAGGGSPPVCNGTCVELGSFTGPFSLDDAGCQRPLRGGYADSKSPFTAAPATCECACELPIPLGCPPVKITFLDETSCDGTSTVTVDLFENDCLGLEARGITGYSFEPPPSKGGASGTCVSDEAAATIPPVELAAPFEACALDESSCGGSNVCVPEDTTGLCLLSAEDVPCPDTFPVRHEVLLESELVDDRDCQCGCGSFSATCTPAFGLYSGEVCAAPEAAQLGKDCVGPLDGGPIESVSYRPIAAGAECSTAPSSFGGVTAGPVNILCCASE